MRIFRSTNDTLATLGLSFLASLATVGYSSMVHAENTTSRVDQQADQHQHYAIPAQSLSGTLAQFARSRGLQLVYEAGLLDGLSAPAVSGQLSEQEVLSRLLGGTQLSWNLTAERTLLISRRQDQSTLSLAPSTITASHFAGEVADGPVDGYRATRAMTATRTDTALRDVPQAIQVVSREVIEEQQLESLGDVLSNVSSVQRSNSHGGSAESFVVRGFRASTYAIDGMLSNPLGERSEVVRKPRDRLRCCTARATPAA